MKKLWIVQRDLPPTRGISTTHLWAEDEAAVKAAIVAPYRFRSCLPAPPPMNGIEAAELERARQMEAEGWTAAHDDAHDTGQLAAAGAAYANWSMAYGSPGDGPPPCWPWEPEAWKPSDRRKRNLEKAMALIAAEWDRLDRLEKAEGAGE